MKKLALLLALLAAPAFAAEYEISTLEELREFMEAVHVEDFAGDTITLTADIDCERGRFNTGDPEYPSTFRGTFDGGGHVISNFVHAATGSTQEGYGVAMFDFAETGAAILNLTLEGTLPGTASGAYAAPFVLAVESPLGLFMDNCHFRGSVTNYYHAAGLVGFASAGTGAGEVPSVALTNCSVRGEIVSTWVYTAGGLVAKGTGVQAFDCSVESELHGGRTGGLVGEAYGGSFEGCSFEGTMRPDRSSVGGCLQGGLVGQASNAVFRACTSVVGLDSMATAAGGAAGVTFGSAAFYDCSATVEAAVPYGRFGGFVGWTAGAETFSNCTASMTVDPIPVINPDAGTTNIYSLTTGGFAASVASDGALFVDCTASARGSDLKAGFYYNQQPYSTNSPVGSNTFLRCHAVNPAAKEAGFCSSAWNCAFEGCTVRGGTGGAGFVQSAGQRPDNSNESTYSYEQTSTFTDCSVHGTRASSGFVMIANSGNKNGHTNVFRRCRAGCIYGNSNNSGAVAVGFGSTLNKGTLVEDCAAYGIADMAHLEAGFAYSIGVGVTVRRCVGAVYPRTTDTQGAGFADLIAYGTTVENCYAVYAPYASAVEPYSDQAYRYGVQGGFVRRTSIGTNEGDLPIVRCFALWPLSEPLSGQWISGSFCGVTPNSTSTNYFEDCYRPAEAAIGSCHNEDAAGVTAFTKAEFATATAATMPNYDFADTWHAPGGVASSPYLDASVDENGDFWFLAGIVGAEGRILVNGEAPREAYPAGSVLTVQAVPDNPDMPFAGWVGEGFADPSAQTTTYTVKNVSAIAAKFCTPIYTVDDWTNRVHATYISEDTTAYALMNDLDFTDYIASNGWNYIDGYYAFAGKLFGQGHTIRGLVTTNGLHTTTRALFSTLSDGAEIRDLTVYSSNVANDQNTLSLAGLATSVGSGVLISNCHAVVNWQGTYTAWHDSNAHPASMFYGLVRNVSGVGIRIVDCTVRGRLAGGTRACGFVGEATLNGGEIARCAVFADVSTLTNRTDGAAAGFAGEITLSGGAVVRECLAAGSVTASATGSGFANSITFRDSASSIRDCYSTMEVSTAGDRYSGGYNASGFADTISGAYDDAGATIANAWFGGSVRGGYQQHAFARSVDDYATLSNCRSVAAAGSRASATAGVASLAPDAARAAASWTGFDFENVWSLAEGATTPYFAWSLTTNGAFRVLAQEEPGTVIAHPATAAPGGAAAIEASAEDADLFFCQWAGGATYTNAAVNPSALLADNHRAVRCVWGKAISTPEQLAAIADDPAGTYALAADIDLNGLDWTPICQDEYTPFTGTLYGNGHTISNLTVDTETARAGLFGGVEDGATIVDLHLANPVVRGANCVGTLAGYVDGANISGCTVAGADVAATSERAGCFVGQIVGDTSVSRCSVVGDIVGSDRYVGGFVGSVEGAAAIDKCYALGSVKGTGGEGFGGFVGYAYGDSVSFSECFACGAVTASERNSVGGFAGYVGDAPAFTDCYALVDAKGGSYVGGFAGQLYYSDTTFARCYAAGASVGSSDVGGFAGRQYRGSPSFTDCFRPANAPGDVGSADLVGIDALDATGFLDADNFAAYLDTGKWSQVDGKTQPYFAWGLVDGRMTLSGSIAGTGDGAITGLGAYAPGTVVPIAAVPDGSVFLGWLGNAPYADASADTTTVTLDNFRIVTAEFGALIMNVDQLAGITNALSGSYALGADIDLSGDGDWRPLGSSSEPFTGSLYGRGFKITGLKFDNTTSGEAAGTHAGLFRYAKDATFVGIVLEDVDLDGYQYVGALAGEVQGATTVRDCSASGTAKSSNGCVGMLVGRVYNAKGTVFEGCEAAGEVVSAGASAGGLVGDIYNSTISFNGCGTDVAVSGTGGNNKGGLVGYIEYGGSVSFTDCWTEGNVTAPSSQYVGGFVGNAARPVRCENCQTFGDTSGSSYTGGFVGQASGEGSTFADCVANGAVTTATANGSYAGGFVGYASGAKSRYEDCSGWGAVAAGSGSQVGGFVGQSSGAGIVFEDCLARGTDVRTTGSAVGGFAGKSSASNEFTRCQAKALAVSGGGNVGGFVGSAEGVNSQYAECEAHGSVKATGYSGGFAGQTSGTGSRYARCSAFGSASSTGDRVGGFAGYVYNSNDVWRCMSAGSATGTQYIGGFIGYHNGGNTAVRECFALGDATATRTGYDVGAGGFVGYANAGANVSDSYCLGTVKGEKSVGGFVGYGYNAGFNVLRCYAAGAVECAGTYAGAFIGYPRQIGTTVDCAALCESDDFHASGTGTAGVSETREGIDELDGAEFKDSDNFAAFLLPDTTPWTQADGVTQPYLAWSSPDGDLMVYASVGGSASGRIDGAGVWYAPGDDATVTAVPDDGGFFVKWTGSTPYASRTSATTTIKMDNHRVAAALLGKLITTPEELDAVRNDLAGIYGLGNDIDLADRPWTPLGDNSKKFTGKFYGFGHEVMNLVATNNPNSGYKGLFGYADGAVLDGVTVSGTAKCNSGYYYVGGLVGRADATSIANCHATVEAEGGRYVGGLVGGVNNGTSVIGCSAAGTVKATSNYAYAGGLAGGCESGAFEIRDSVSSAEVTAVASYVGGFIGYVNSSGASVISGCRADGYTGGAGDVGGFVGYVSAPLAISDCVARGDVRSSGSNYGGFVGRLNHASATIANCWCSGAVWGTGGTIGAFVGYLNYGTIASDCAVAASANGGRAFNGRNVDQAGATLSDYGVKQRSNGWPEVEPRWKSATPISTAEDLAAITNGGVYRLTADIDLGGAAWTPLFQSSGFTGELYGGNYAVSNFVVDTTAQYAGLFGQISGGRVEGVRAFGKVRSSSGYVGGFAGRIGSYSHVKGCSFKGEVESSSTRVGGFVGGVSEYPTIHRCCAVGSVRKTGSTGSGYVGGFVGDLGSGPVADSYASGTVDADGSGYAGGFAGQINSDARVLATYCSAPVTTTSSSYVGAFGGYVYRDNLVTNSYYNAGDGTRLARGQNGSSAAYVGIDPVASADMTKQTSFPAFDFTETWLIDEGETSPYLKCFESYEIDSFERWLKYRAGLPAGTRPEEMVNGIPAAARYLFDIVPPASVDTNGMPVCRICIDQNGSPYLQFAERKYPDEWNTKFTILSRPDLENDWIPSEGKEYPKEHDVDGNGRCNPGIPAAVDRMFFKYRMHLD